MEHFPALIRRDRTDPITRARGDSPNLLFIICDDLNNAIAGTPTSPGSCARS